MKRANSKGRKAAISSRCSVGSNPSPVFSSAFLFLLHSCCVHAVLLIDPHFSFLSSRILSFPLSRSSILFLIFVLSLPFLCPAMHRVGSRSIPAFFFFSLLLPTSCLLSRSYHLVSIIKSSSVSPLRFVMFSLLLCQAMHTVLAHWKMREAQNVTLDSKILDLRQVEAWQTDKSSAWLAETMEEWRQRRRQEAAEGWKETAPSFFVSSTIPSFLSFSIPFYLPPSRLSFHRLFSLSFCFLSFVLSFLSLPLLDVFFSLSSSS